MAKTSPTKLTLLQNREVAKSLPDGWVLYLQYRFDSRAAAIDHIKEEPVSVNKQLLEAKVIKRGGKKDPHWLVLHKLPETL